MSSTSSLIMAVVLAFALAWFPRSLYADGTLQLVIGICFGGFGDRTVHSEASFRQLNRAAELRAACKWITSASTVVPLRVDEARRPRKLLGLPRPCVVAGAGFPEHYTAPETYVRRFNTARLRAGNRSTCPRSVAMDLLRNRSPNFLHRVVGGGVSDNLGDDLLCRQSGAVPTCNAESDQARHKGR